MSAVKGKNTRIELAIRKTVHHEGFRYSLHNKSLPGKPDLALKKYGVAVFVNGCFWHGHSCRKGKRPTSNKNFWDVKLERNVKRDRDNTKQLKKLGWEVVTIWECEIEKGARKLVRKLNHKKKRLQELPKQDNHPKPEKLGS